MELNNKLYDFLKYAVQIGSPALLTAITALGSLYGWENTDILVGTIAVITTLVGTLIGVSSRQYHKNGGDLNGISKTENN